MGCKHNKKTLETWTWNRWWPKTFTRTRTCLFWVKTLSNRRAGGLGDPQKLYETTLPKMVVMFFGYFSWSTFQEDLGLAEFSVNMSKIQAFNCSYRLISHYSLETRLVSFSGCGVLPFWLGTSRHSLNGAKTCFMSSPPGSLKRWNISRLAELFYVLDEEDGIITQQRAAALLAVPPGCGEAWWIQPSNSLGFCRLRGLQVADVFSLNSQVFNTIQLFQEIRLFDFSIWWFNF